LPRPLQQQIDPADLGARLPQEFAEALSIVLQPVESHYRCTFRRGFVEHIELGAADFARNADRLFAHVPLQEIAVADGPFGGGMSDLFRAPAVARLRGLEIRGLIGVATVNHLIACPYLTRLRRLSVERVTVQGVGPAVLADVVNMPNLAELSLAGVPIGDEG